MSLEQIELPKQCCARCHFLRMSTLVRTTWGSFSSSETRYQPINAAQRAQVANGEDEKLVLGGGWSLCCYHEAFGSGGFPADLFLDRKGDCLFYPARLGMSMNAAERLERRAADRRWVKWSIAAGIVGAAIGAIIGALLS